MPMLISFRPSFCCGMVVLATVSNDSEGTISCHRVGAAALLVFIFAGIVRRWRWMLHYVMPLYGGNFPLYKQVTPRRWFLGMAVAMGQTGCRYGPV